MATGMSQSYMEALPDFVKLAEAYGARGIRATKPTELDDAIKEMIDHRRAGDLRLSCRQVGQLLPDDPVGRSP